MHRLKELIRRGGGHQRQIPSYTSQHNNDDDDIDDDWKGDGDRLDFVCSHSGTFQKDRVVKKDKKSEKVSIYEYLIIYDDHHIRSS